MVVALHFAAVSHVNEQPAAPQVVWQSVPAAQVHAAPLQVQPTPVQAVPDVELPQAWRAKASVAIAIRPIRLEVKCLIGSSSSRVTESRKNSTRSRRRCCPGR